MRRLWSVPLVLRLAWVLAIAAATMSCGLASNGPPVETSIAPGVHPQLTADDAARITRDYLDVQTTELAAPELHTTSEIAGVWAVTASAAWSVDGCIPRQASDDVVWVTKGRGDYLNLTDRPWSRGSGYADARHPQAFVCVGPGPMGTLVIDDRSGEVLGVYPANDGYPHPSPAPAMTPTIEPTDVPNIFSFDVENQSKIAIVVSVVSDAAGAMPGLEPGQQGTISIPVRDPENGISVEIQGTDCRLLASGTYPTSAPFTLLVEDGPLAGTVRLSSRPAVSTGPMPLPSNSLVGCGG